MGRIGSVVRVSAIFQSFPLRSCYTPRGGTSGGGDFHWEVISGQCLLEVNSQNATT